MVEKIDEIKDQLDKAIKKHYDEFAALAQILIAKKSISEDETCSTDVKN